MNTKVYVETLATATTQHELMDLFSACGKIADVNIAVDRTHYKPRRFGFVTMVTPEGARAAIERLNGKPLGTGTLTVSEAWPSEERAGSRNGRRKPGRRASHVY